MAVGAAATHVRLTPRASAAIGAEGSHSWLARSLTVSMLELDSRSGTEMELTRAAAACAEHGVQKGRQKGQRRAISVCAKGVFHDSP